MTLKHETSFGHGITMQENDFPDQLSELDKHLLNDYQHGFPLSETPFHDIANTLGVSEEEVINRFRYFQDTGIISRMGPVIRANTIGTSTLAAMAVPDNDIERVAALINTYAEVNHNYERDDEYNLWFVVTADDDAHLTDILDSIEQKTGYALLNLPMINDFHIDLGFKLQWQV